MDSLLLFMAGTARLGFIGVLAEDTKFLDEVEEDLFDEVEEGEVDID